MVDIDHRCLVALMVAQQMTVADLRQLARLLLENLAKRGLGSAPVQDQLNRPGLVGIGQGLDALPGIEQPLQRFTPNQGIRVVRTSSGSPPASRPASDPRSGT